MSKGIKMLSALDGSNRTQTLESLQLLADNLLAIPALRCDGKGCLVPVRFVPKGVKDNPGKEPSERKAYIGLTAAVASDHKATCQYNASEQLKQILVAQSDSNFIDALNTGASELRLLLLHNKLGGKDQPETAPPESSITGASSQPKSTNYQPTATQLDSYLRTTADILKLRERCEADDLLSQTLTLRFGTRVIRWSDFYFEHGRYENAWKMAHNRGATCHPFAIMGTVEQFRPPEAGVKNRNGFLDLHSERNKPNADNIAHTFSISIGDRKSAWLNALPNNAEIIVFGVWTVTKPKENIVIIDSDPPREITYMNHALTLYPKFHTQLFRVI